MSRFEDLGPSARHAAATGAVGLALWALSSAASAQFKIVNPDGTVSYSDRPPAVAANTRITNLGRPGSPSTVEPDVALPAELRQPVLRHPVVLYTTTECSPCESGRQMLVTRGVPFNERRVGTEEDAQAFERLFGTRTLPLLTVGAQGLKGLSESEWAAYLDAAGYPRQSRMPRGWQPAAATAMVERAAPVAATRAQPVPASPPVVIDNSESTPGRVRF